MLEIFKAITNENVWWYCKPEDDHKDIALCLFVMLYSSFSPLFRAATSFVVSLIRI